MPANPEKPNSISLDVLINQKYRQDNKQLSDVEVLTIAFKIAELLQGLHQQKNANVNLDPKYIQVSLDPIDITPTPDFFKSLTKLNPAQPLSAKQDGLQFGNLMQKMGINGFKDFSRQDNLQKIPIIGEAVSRLDDLVQQAKAVKSKVEARKVLATKKLKQIEAVRKLFQAEQGLLESKLGTITESSDSNIAKRNEAIRDLESATSVVQTQQFEAWQTYLNPEFTTNVYELFIKSSNQTAQQKMIDFLEHYSNASNLRSELPLLSLEQIQMLSKGANTLKTQISLYQKIQFIQHDLTALKTNLNRDQYEAISQRIDELQNDIKAAQTAAIPNANQLNEMLMSATADIRIIQEMIYKQKISKEVLSEVSKTARKVQSKPIERTPEAVVEAADETPEITQPTEKDTQADLRDRVRKLQSQVLQLEQQSPQTQALIKKRDSASQQLNALQQQLTYFSSPLSQGYQSLAYEDFKKLTPIQKLEIVKGMHDIVHDAHKCGLILNDLALDRFGIHIAQDGRISVEYQGNADAIVHLQGHEANLSARADIFFLGETFKQLKLSAKLTDPMTTIDSEKRVTDEQLSQKFQSLMPNQAALTAQKIEKEKQLLELKWQIHQFEKQAADSPAVKQLNRLVDNDPDMALSLFQKATQSNQQNPLPLMLKEMTTIQKHVSGLEKSTQSIQESIVSLTSNREELTTELDALDIQLSPYLQAQRQLKQIIDASPQKIETGKLTFIDPLKGGQDVFIAATQAKLKELSGTTDSNIMSHGNYISKDYAQDRLEKLNRHLQSDPTYQRYIATSVALTKLDQKEAKMRESLHSKDKAAKSEAQSLLKTWRHETQKSLDSQRKQETKGSSTVKKPDAPKKPKRSQ